MLFNEDKMILDLCGGTGAWSEPYRKAGYRVDIVTLPLQDVRLLNLTMNDYGPIYGILAAPPCDNFAVSGARWWDEKGEKALLESLSIVDACLRVVLATNPQWWALENPVGRLKHYLGKPKLKFNPCDYGDPYTKKTLLWGDFNWPYKKNQVEPKEGSKMHLLPPSEKRKELRSITPSGFAKAFFEANP
jgi:hypothetical protein